MSGEESEGYAFVCPECEERLEINEKMKHTLIERGCVICGTSVTEEAFTEDSFFGSS
jgi:transcription initiation factor IIE alpha subunit